MDPKTWSFRLVGRFHPLYSWEVVDVISGNFSVDHEINMLVHLDILNCAQSGRIKISTAVDITWTLLKMEFLGYFAAIFFHPRSNWITDAEIKGLPSHKNLLSCWEKLDASLTVDNSHMSCLYVLIYLRKKRNSTKQERSSKPLEP